MGLGRAMLEGRPRRGLPGECLCQPAWMSPLQSIADQNSATSVQLFFQCASFLVPPSGLIGKCASLVGRLQQNNANGVVRFNIHALCHCKKLKSSCRWEGSGTVVHIFGLGPPQAKPAQCHLAKQPKSFAFASPGIHHSVQPGDQIS